MPPIMERPNAILKSEFVNIQAFSCLSGKKVKIDNISDLRTIQEHLLCCNYSPSFKYFSILTRESNDFKLKIMESLLIARDQPILNKERLSKNTRERYEILSQEEKNKKRQYARERYRNLSEEENERKRQGGCKNKGQLITKKSNL